MKEPPPPEELLYPHRYPHGVPLFFFPHTTALSPVLERSESIQEHSCEMGSEGVFAPQLVRLVPLPAPPPLWGEGG